MELSWLSNPNDCDGFSGGSECDDANDSFSLPQFVALETEERFSETRPTRFTVGNPINGQAIFRVALLSVFQVVHFSLTLIVGACLGVAILQHRFLSLRELALLAVCFVIQISTSSFQLNRELGIVCSRQES